MKQFCIFLSLFLSVALATLAQQATNVRVQQEGEQIIITYDLDKTAYVRVYVATGQSNQYTELKAVTGNVGKGVQPGTNRRITWMPLEERTEFVAQNVRFKVEAKSIRYYFSVSPTKKVAFSPGNLQYRASTNTWRFAPHQWEYIGNANTSVSKTYTGWIDLFGWGTSKNPYKVRKTNRYELRRFVDWGINTIGTEKPNTWRTLTYDEWKYLIGHTRWTMAKVNGVLGFMLLHDDFSCPTGLRVNLLSTGRMSSSFVFSVSAYAPNQYTTDEFAQLEAKGCVFLPCAGYRRDLSVHGTGSHGYYWLAHPNFAGELNFGGHYKSKDLASVILNENMYVPLIVFRHKIGESVRLVQDLK